MTQKSAFCNYPEARENHEFIADPTPDPHRPAGRDTSPKSDTKIFIDIFAAYVVFALSGCYARGGWEGAAVNEL